MWFESCFLFCMGAYIDLYRNITNKLPSFSNLCKSNINKTKL